MRRCAESLGGTLDVSGDQGTVVTARLPVGTNPWTVRVVLADDHPMSRFGLRAALDAEDAIEVEVKQPTARNCSPSSSTPSPTSLTHLGMPRLDGAEAARRIQDPYPKAAVLVLTMHEDDEALFAALRAGAQGYLLKSADRTDIVRAVHNVAAGKAAYAAAVARRIVDFFTGAARLRRSDLPGTDHPRARGSRRSGSRNRQPRDRPATRALRKDVRNHVSAILLKLQAPDRSTAIVKARDASLGR